MDSISTSFGLLAGFAILSRFGPFLVQLLFCVGLCAIGLRGEGRGWRLIAIAGGLATLNQLLYAYPLYQMTMGRISAAEVGRMMMAYNVVNTLLRVVEGPLLLIGLLTLQQRQPGGRA